MKRVLLIHPEGNTYNNPTLKSVMDLLYEKGIHVTIRYHGGPAPMPSMPNVSLLPYGRLLGYVKWIITHVLVFHWLVKLSVWCEKIFVYEDYDLIIGIDREGLVEGSVLHQMSGIPFVFFSFEILFASETSVRFKSIEFKASKFVKKWFIQDVVRADQIQCENGLDQSTRVLVPVSSAGVGVVGSIRLRDQLGIPKEKKVAIVMGTLASWSMTKEIVSTIDSWPTDWVLLIHNRYGNTAKVLEKNGVSVSSFPVDRIFLSENSPSFVDDMSVVLAGVNAGFAFYRPNYADPYLGKNIFHIGLASGKISTLMRYGIPPILNEIGTYAGLAITHDFGVVIKDEQQIASALSSISDDSWSKSALLFFQNQLDFDLYKQNVWTAFEDAASSRIVKYANNHI